MKPYVDEVAGALSPAEAELVGAFREDALTEADAQASVGDDYETPAEALGAKPL
jgi:hypothetical protein